MAAKHGGKKGSGKGGGRRRVYWSLGCCPQPDAKGNGGVKFGSRGGAHAYLVRLLRETKVS